MAIARLLLGLATGRTGLRDLLAELLLGELHDEAIVRGMSLIITKPYIVHLF